MDDSLSTPHVPAVPAEVAIELTPSGLVYLFANRLVPKGIDRNSGGSVKLPGWNMTIRKRPLAVLLFATAMWNLQEQGYVLLALYEEPTWIPMRKRLRISVQVAKREQARHRGLERVIMANLPTSGRTNAYSVIQHYCSSERSIDPWKDIVATVADEVNNVGQVGDKLATLEGAFHSFVGRWQRFKMIEPVLYKALLDECEKDIASIAGSLPNKYVSTGIGMSGAFDYWCPPDKPAGNGTDGGLGDLLSDFFDGDFDFD